MGSAEAAVDLLWIPLGAGSRVPVVRWNGLVYEAMSAWHQRRPRADLFHAALEVQVDVRRYVIEMTPAWGPAHSSAGAVTAGPVGMRPLGRSKYFRYEVHCWRDGVIPDRAYAVGGPRRVSTDEQVAHRVLALAPSFPTCVWGRDEQGVGEMWNSNSLVAWLLVSAGIAAAALEPPPGGRAPGWAAGVAVASSHQSRPTGRAGSA
jgi:hypothetical protein